MDALLVGPNSDLESGQTLMDTLALKYHVHSLRVLLDPALLLDKQSVAVARSAFYHLWLICKLRPFLENKNLITVTHALVISSLDYCYELYMGLPLKTERMLQLIQNLVIQTSGNQ